MADKHRKGRYISVKNSWDVDNPYDGYIYMSEAFIKFKMTDMMVNKKAIPADIAKKLGIK